MYCTDCDSHLIFFHFLPVTGIMSQSDFSIFKMTNQISVLWWLFWFCSTNQIRLYICYSPCHSYDAKVSYGTGSGRSIQGRCLKLRLGENLYDKNLHYKVSAKVGRIRIYIYCETSYFLFSFWRHINNTISQFLFLTRHLRKDVIIFQR